MENTEKLLEAARTIQDHCIGTVQYKPCIFADGAVCQGASNCRLCKLPDNWAIPNPTRWTTADKAIAEGLKAYGYNSVTRNEDYVFVLSQSKSAIAMGKEFFASLENREVVNLDKIIGEDKDGKDF